jgi:hypothetical protein
LRKKKDHYNIVSWGYNPAVDLFNDAETLIEDTEKFAFINKMPEESIIDTATLQMIISEFDEITEDWEDEDESEILEFSADLSDRLEDFKLI